jgi:hypothetical protein
MDSRRVNTMDALGMLEHRRSVHVSWLSIGALSSGAVSLGSFLLTGSIRTQALVTACMAVAWVGGLIEGDRQARSLPAAVPTRATHGAQYRLAEPVAFVRNLALTWVNAGQQAIVPDLRRSRPV